MSVTAKRVYAILAASILVAAYFLFPIVLWPKLEFRERAFPKGFRELVLDSASSQIDPLFGAKPGPPVVSKLSAREICDALFRDVNSPALGTRDSRLQIIAFLDYRCPYCKKLSIVLPQIQDEKKIRVIYKEWPILGDSSVLAAHAGLAADRQGKYLEFHTRLMSTRFIPTVAYIEEIAANLGMDQSRLRVDMNSVVIADAIRQTITLASALSLVGTPALVIGRTIVQGEITRRQLEHLIDDEIQRPEKACEGTGS
jgi:predicted DsbA family dithiol-disulfide isomerase